MTSIQASKSQAEKEYNLVKFKFDKTLPERNYFLAALITVPLGIFSLLSNPNLDINIVIFGIGGIVALFVVIMALYFSRNMELQTLIEDYEGTQKEPREFYLYWERILAIATGLFIAIVVGLLSFYGFLF
jgi:uncharacterized membrane protein YiaA